MDHDGGRCTKTTSRRARLEDSSRLERAHPSQVFGSIHAMACLHHPTEHHLWTPVELSLLKFYFASSSPPKCGLGFVFACRSVILILNLILIEWACLVDFVLTVWALGYLSDTGLWQLTSRDRLRCLTLKRKRIGRCCFEGLSDDAHKSHFGMTHHKTCNIWK